VYKLRTTWNQIPLYISYWYLYKILFNYNCTNNYSKASKKNFLFLRNCNRVPNIDSCWCCSTHFSIVTMLQLVLCLKNEICTKSNVKKLLLWKSFFEQQKYLTTSTINRESCRRCLVCHAVKSNSFPPVKPVTWFHNQKHLSVEL
jgi:hypothetical protein